MWISGHTFRVLTSKLKNYVLFGARKKALKCSFKCWTPDWEGSGHGPLLLPTHVNAPICLHALAALSPGLQTGSTSYVLSADCIRKHTHIPWVVCLIPSGGHRGSWSGLLSPAGCFTDLFTWFHPLSKLGSLRTKETSPWHLMCFPCLTLRPCHRHSLKNWNGERRKPRGQNSGFGIQIYNLLKILTQDQCRESDWNHTKSVLILSSEGKLT